MIITLVISILINVIQYFKYESIIQKAEKIFCTNFTEFPLGDMEYIDDKNFKIDQYNKSIFKFSKAVAISEIITDGSIYTDEDHDYSLSVLLKKIEDSFFMDRNKLSYVFSTAENKQLIAKVGTDPNDRQSINKLIELLK